MKACITFLCVLISCYSLAQSYDITGDYTINGNVGIGTTTPETSLHVKAGEVKIHNSIGVLSFDQAITESENEFVRSTIFSTRDGDLNWSSNQWTIGQGDHNDFAGFVHRSTGILSFYTGEANAFSSLSNGQFRNDFERMTILGDGNIGIGTTYPEDRLQVATTTAHDIFSLKRVNSVNGNTYDFRISSSSNGQNSLAPRSLSIVALEHAADIALLANPNNQEPQFVLKSTGDVGIGTADPKSKLSVNGQIRATEVKVLADITVVPDYVFEPDYELRTLKETKEYIEKNKHLPEIPSAKEMDANGINLGEMDMKLLKKIEELTLYQIDLLEKVEELQNKVRELEKN